MTRNFWQWVGYIIENYSSMFIKGAAVTMLIAITGTLIGLLIGLIIGAIRTIPSQKGKGGRLFRGAVLRVVNVVLSLYIEVFRGTPMIVQAMVIYYGLMESMGIDLSPIAAGILVVSINTGAYMAEIVRAGIQSIDIGQTEAAGAIGMTHWQTMRHVILPQAIRNILPAIGNEFIINIKDTSVLNVISVTELFFNAKSVKGNIYRTYETFLVAAAIYLVLTYTVTRILRVIERKMAGPSDYLLVSTSSTMPEQIMGRNRRRKK